MRTSARIYQYRVRYPLVNGGLPQAASGWEVTKAFREAGKTFRQMRKPAFRTPASWVDDFVSLGKNVRLCTACASRWLGWAKANDYAFVGESVGDCMACGAEWMKVYRYRPEQEALKEKKQNATLR